MPYDLDLLAALATIEKNQGEHKPLQPLELVKSPPEREKIECKADGPACNKAFDPKRDEDDAGAWCAHERAAMKVFRAIEAPGKVIKESGVYELFCEHVFAGGSRKPTVTPANLKGISRGCYKITKPTSWGCNAGKWQNLKDVMRISVEFEDLPSLYAGAKELVRKVGVIGGSGDGLAFKGWRFGPIYRIKDRFATPPIGIFDEPGKVNPEAEVEVIYKDYQVILAARGPFPGAAWFSPYLIELQLHVEAMLQAKKTGGHKIYQKMRVLRTDERDALVRLVKESNDVYGKAFDGGLNDDIDYIDPALVKHLADNDVDVHRFRTFSQLFASVMGK